MTPEIEALRSNRAVIVSVIAAAISITLLCLVGIAVMLGWAGARRTPATPASVATAPKQSSAISPGAALIPGETLVMPAEGSATPAAAPPDAQSAAPPLPPARAEPAPRPRPATPAYVRPGEPQGNRAPRKATRAEPATDPGSARSEAHPTESGDPWQRKFVCRTCGTVTAIATFPDFWEVRVRLEDGASFSVRYPAPPSLRIGDRVRLANGRLERE